MTRSFEWSAACLLSFAGLGACASDDGVQGDRTATALSASELAVTELGFNEDTCAGTLPDGVATAAVTSADESYDHATCPHQFVVTRRLPRTKGLVVGAAYAGGIGGDFACSGSWAQVAVWKRRITVPENSRWTKVGESALVLGTDGITDGCKAQASVHLPDDPRAMEYQVVAQAGWTLTYQRVAVSFSP